MASATDGIWAVTAFTTDQCVTIQHTPRCYPFDARVIKGVESGGDKVRVKCVMGRKTAAQCIV